MNDQPCDNCTPSNHSFINVDERNMCTTCGKPVTPSLKPKYKPEYLDIAKNSKSLVELAGKIGVEIQTIMAWANKKKKDEQGNKTEELARPEFMLIVSELFKMKPEEKAVEEVKPKHAGGRPTKYSEEMLQKANDYLAMSCPENMEVPTVEGLAIALDIDDDTVVEWSKLYPEFSATIKRLKSKQKMHLINAGMFGGKEVNSTMAIFLLKVNHGLVETNNVDLRSNGESINQVVSFNYLPPAIDATNNPDNKANS